MAFAFSSLTACRLEIKASSGKIISTATGTWYRRVPESQLYLLTNWHVVTDRSPFDLSMTSTGAVPTLITAHLHANVGPNQINSGAIIELNIPINAEDGMEPVWFEHPELQRRFDVVAIPIRMSPEQLIAVQIRAFGDAGIMDGTPLYEPGVADDVFVLGFPWGFTGGSPALPIYKRGSVASEPFFGQGGLPRFLIDCRTARGMSGSPVIAMRKVFGDKVGPGAESRFGTATKFAGIYSGRLTIDDIGQSRDSAAARIEQLSAISEIGIVWQAMAIDELVDHAFEGWKIGSA